MRGTSSPAPAAGSADVKKATWETTGDVFDVLVYVDSVFVQPVRDPLVIDKNVKPSQ